MIHRQQQGTHIHTHSEPKTLKSKEGSMENYTLTAKDPKQLFGIRRTLWESTLGSGSLLWALGGYWEATGRLLILELLRALGAYWEATGKLLGGHWEATGSLLSRATDLGSEQALT